jgi:hypothetical protein
MVGFLMGKCDPCGAINVEQIDPADPEHMICKGCGAKLTPLTPPGNIFTGGTFRPGISRTKGWLSKNRIAFVPQRDRDGDLVRVERTFDRENDRYFERVTLYDSGEVIHYSDEPLSEHKGHGSAKK